MGRYLIKPQLCADSTTYGFMIDISADDDLSNVIAITPEAVTIAIWAPATLTGTITVQVAPDVDSAAAAFLALQSSGADVTLTESKCTTITASGFGAMRLASDGNEAADRVFPVRIQTQVN